MTAIFQSSNPTWSELHPDYRIYSQIEQILSDNSVREVHIVTAWMSIQALDAFTGVLTEIAGRNGARVVFVLGNQPPLNRLTDRAVFNRLLTWDENHESIEAYVHSAGTSNKIFHPKFFCFRDNAQNWRMIAGSSNMTLSGLGIESGAGISPNTEFVVVGNLEGETRQQMLDILDFLGNNENSIRLNSDEGRTFVESYQKTRIGANGQPSGTTLEQDQLEDDDFNQDLLVEEPEVEEPELEEPELEEPEVEEPEVEEPGLYPLPRDLTEISHQNILEYIYHYTGGDWANNIQGIARDMHVFRTTGNRSGHFHQQVALAVHYVLSEQPYHILQVYRDSIYERQDEVREHFASWVSQEIIQNNEIVSNSKEENQTINQIRQNFSGWGGERSGGNWQYCISRTLFWIANNLWDPEINPSVPEIVAED